MAAPASKLFERAEPWTEEDFPALPVDRRIELLDGSLEITSPGNAAVDQAIKPELYAQAGIPFYLRVELGPTGPRGHLHRAVQGGYREALRSAPGESLVLAEPLHVTLDLAASGAATRRWVTVR